MDFSQSHSPFVSSLRQIAYGNQNKSFPAKDFSSPSAHFLVQAKCACGMFPTATMAELNLSIKPNRQPLLFRTILNGGGLEIPKVSRKIELSEPELARERVLDFP